ncbi:MAG: Imm51 family immunity protein [Chitinophagaceae bacterium]
MSGFATKSEHHNEFSVYFNIEADEVMAIGRKMESINEQAYINGYNWEAFLNCYLQTNNPELLEGLDTDSEAGTYVALYNKSNSDKADKLVTLINGLVNNPGKIYSFLEENGEDIEWD